MRDDWAAEALSIARGSGPRPPARPLPARAPQASAARPDWASEARAVVAPRRAIEIAAEEEDEQSFFDRWAPTGVRIAAPVIGGVLGSVVPGIGTAAGAAAGAALGGIAGEIGAEKLEGRELDPVDIGLAGALSAIPAGPAGRVAANLAKEAAETGARNLGRRALLHTAEGAAQGALEATARPIVKEGRAPTFEELGTGAVFGGALGGTLGTGLDVALRPRRPAIEAAIEEMDARRLPGDPPPFPETITPRDNFDVAPDPPPFVESTSIDAPPLTPEPPPFMAIERALREMDEPEPAPFPIDPPEALAPERPTPPAIWDRSAPLEFDAKPPELPRTPQEVAADMAMLEAPRLQAEADEAMLAALEAERAQPVSARIPEWEGEAADAARMAREATQAQTSVPPDPRAPVEGYRPAIARQPLEEPGVTFTETTPQPRDGDRRQVAEPTPTERRIADRRARLAAELGLPPEHAAVERLHAVEVEARTDPLTGLMNKRGWEETLSTVGPEDHVVVLDMRRLKPVNDKFGHGAGDHAIRTFAGVVREVFGDGDAGRFGGDEMGAVLRGMNRQQAEQLVETFRQKAANRPTTLRNPQTGETIDIPGFEAHIGVGKSFGEADAAANAAAAASRAGGRGDVPIVPRGSNDPSGNPPVGAAPETPGRGLGDRPPELNAGVLDAGAPSVQAADAPRAPALPGGSRRVGEPDIGPAAAVADVGDAARDVPPAQPVADRRLFDREAAKARMLERAKRLGSEANSLGSAAAEGPGVLRDAAEIGASYIEDFARRNGGKIPPFQQWANTVGQVLAGTVKNVGRFLREIYDAAVGLFRGAQPQAAAQPIPAQEIGAPPVQPKPGPKPVPQPASPPPPKQPAREPIATSPIGKPTPAGEVPRVEQRVESLRAAEKEIGEVPSVLDRETRQKWTDLDPEVQRILRTYDDDQFYNIMKRRNLDAPETMAWDARVRGKQERLDELRTKMAEGKDDTARKDLVAAELEFIAAQRASVNDGTGLGRALAARARIMEASRTPDDTFLKKVFRELPNVSDQQAAEMVRAFRENPENLQPMLHAAIGHGKLQKAIEWWKAGMLSGVSTDVANFSGNFAEHHMKLAETGVASAADWLLRTVYGGDRARFAGEVGAEWSQANQALGPALKQLGRNLRDVFTLKDKPISLQRKLEHQVGAIGGTMGKVVRTSFGKLEAMDQFFQAWGGAAEMGKLAYRKAARAGGTKAQIQARAAKILGELSDPKHTDHADILRTVARAKEERTFQEKRAESMTESINQFVMRHPWMNLVLPFRRTPGNIANKIIQRSPLGAGRALRAWSDFKRVAADPKSTPFEIAEARGVLADAIAPPLLGTALLTGFGALASAGGMTGGGPTDPQEKNTLKDSGWQPYSFVFTGPEGKKVYIPFNRFEPVSSLMGFAADMVEAKDAKTAGDLLDKALGSVVENLSSKSYLQGLTDAGNLLADPKRYASNYVSGLAGSFLVPNIVARTAQAIDPTIRDTRPESEGLPGIVEKAGRTVVSRIPRASTTLDERRSGLGEPTKRQGNALTRFALPVQPSMEKEGAAFNELLVNLEAVPSAPQRDISVKGRKVRLSDEEYKFLQDADQKVTERLRRRTESPAFKRLPPEDQRREIRTAYDSARGQARRRVLRSPGFVERARKTPKATA